MKNIDIWKRLEEEGLMDPAVGGVFSMVTLRRLEKMRCSDMRQTHVFSTLKQWAHAVYNNNLTRMYLYINE